jgi:putative phage-type endonuclease
MTEDELQERKRMITASRIGSVFGVDPYCDLHRMILQMRGEAERQAQPWMMAGKRWERPIAMVYQEETGREVEWFDRLVKHPDHPWLGASPDALVRADEEVLDFKLAQWHQRHKFGPTPEDVPPQHILQLQTQMGVMGYQQAKLVVWAGETELRVYPYEFDELMFRTIVERCSEIYYTYVLTDQLPPITGSEESSEWLKQRFPKNFGTVRRATPVERELLERYTDVRIREKMEGEQIEYNRKLYENRIKEQIGSDDGIEWIDGRFTWKKIKDSETVDWEPLARTLLLSRSEEEQADLVKRFTTTKVGYRKIHFTSDRLREAPSGEELIKDAERGLIAG